MKTVFVVDDDPEQAELLASALAQEGRRVRAFSDPIRALGALASEQADLLIADLSMPWMDGAQIVETARRRHPRLQIILVSGYPRGAAVALRTGVPFFSKPIQLDDLREEVEKGLDPNASEPELAT